MLDSSYATKTVIKAFAMTFDLSILDIFDKNNTWCIGTCFSLVLTRQDSYCFGSIASHIGTQNLKLMLWSLKHVLNTITNGLDISMSCWRVRKATKVKSSMKAINLNKPMIDLLSHPLLIKNSKVSSLQRPQHSLQPTLAMIISILWCVRWLQIHSKL